eukprot:6220122-Amphidinium_carterae.2
MITCKVEYTSWNQEQHYELRVQTMQGASPVFAILVVLQFCSVGRCSMSGHVPAIPAQPWNYLAGHGRASLR